MDKVDKSLLGADFAGAREQLRESLAKMGGLRTVVQDLRERLHHCREDYHAKVKALQVERFGHA